MSLTYSGFKFSIIKEHSPQAGQRARLGLLKTPHGEINTPAFIFCATKAAIKGASPATLRQANTQIILSNTYHLMLDPGPELIAAAGGLHKFMGWSGPLLTDSGGFQIFSLGYGSVAEEIKGKRRLPTKSSLVKITEEGVEFKSHLNGARHLLTPERSINIQCQLGVDFVVVLDECTPFHVDKTYTAKSMALSHRWAERSYKQFCHSSNGKNALYGIVQGGVYSDLRSASADFVNSLPFFGQAIGGSLGADKKQMYDIVGETMTLLRHDRPVHLLGIGNIADIFWGVKNGIDTFDCVHPTRLARHGGALVPYKICQSRREHINLRNSQFKLDFRPIDSDCGCSVCQQFSRAYINYLLRAKEMLALQLLTEHNIYAMNRLCSEIREGIMNDNLIEIEKYWCGDERL